MAIVHTVFFVSRALQLLFAIILLGLCGYLVTDNVIYNQPSQVNFMLFNSVWTLFPAVPFLAYSHRILPARPSSKLIHVAVDAVTMLFWFAGFIALAEWRNNIILCVGKGCGVTVAVIIFGVLEWILFSLTTTLSALDAWQARGKRSPVTTAAPETTTV
ncbi:MAG: hypothetical protein Q9178_002607 [Gyalolechia marmorata]